MKTIFQLRQEIKAEFVDVEAILDLIEQQQQESHDFAELIRQIHRIELAFLKNRLDNGA